MLTFTTGDIFESKAEALVNTVNTVGVMGKGIALQFKRRYPANFAAYHKACSQQALDIGQLLIFQDHDQQGRRTIINFPTKRHWRQPSQYSYIEQGLEALKLAIAKHGLQSIAIPPLGCGQGGLDWIKVRSMIANALGDTHADIMVYEPNPKIQAQLLQSEPPSTGKLTPARAMLLEAQFLYEREGAQTNLFVATKLAYFLQRLGQPLQLEFKPHFYGPYNPKVAHVMSHLNGSFLSGMEQGAPRPFETIYLDYKRRPELLTYLQQELTPAEQERLHHLSALLMGFESVYSLEVLATVDYLRTYQAATTVQAITESAAAWSDRKRDMLQPGHVQIALAHLDALTFQGILATSAID